MADITDLAALVDDGITAINADDLNALRKVASKMNLIIASTPETTTDQTFTAFRATSEAVNGAIKNLEAAISGGIVQQPAEFQL